MYPVGIRQIFCYLLFLVWLYGCYPISGDFLAYKQGSEVFAEQILDYCDFTDDFDRFEDQHLATIYFDSYSYNLGDLDIDVINEVLYLHQKCVGVLLLVGHVSNFETQNSPDAFMIAYQRAYTVYHYMLYSSDFIFTDNYIQLIFCDNKKKLFQEASSDANLYNQRVDVVLLADKNQNVLKYCL